ncbi:MAG: hypothetical protein WC359_13925 [Dehalococcoidia bacterium]
MLKCEEVFSRSYPVAAARETPGTMEKHWTKPISSAPANETLKN